ncbi:serine/threonine-protein phosphatase 7 long form-like protein [Cucumis melo var. makuwa]|uniref:Serine/threonine-protein phosphatase 7 long form-like protein n=1 Tax=Cucumis melo var. makuwa TaxID=1194695 RepID=A0A5A7UVU3_CUCMM|nr:serine/threonine-protein phosphatase 7 long form-like protein [Cucumis melo var. makuwa]
MPCGKCTITLQDVAVQLGLPMDGEPLTGSLRYNWKVIYEDFLEIVPPDMKGQRLSLPWLEKQFEELLPDADVVSIQRYARAYIMQLIGGFLFTDKSNTLGTLSSEPCTVLRDCWPINAAISIGIRQIPHCSATENATTFRWPTFEFQINWTQYTSDIMASLPLRCRSGQAVWTYVGPLICFHLVEKHQPDRAL